MEKLIMPKLCAGKNLFNCLSLISFSGFRFLVAFLPNQLFCIFYSVDNIDISNI